jgi:hypothetical protein
VPVSHPALIARWVISRSSGWARSTITSSATTTRTISAAPAVEFDGFRAEIGGELSGEETANYKDIETSVALLVGRIDVYKVDDHCSAHSTNEFWLETTQPTVAIISTGNV